MRSAPDARQLLERRAAALAQRPARETAVATLEVVTVTVGGRRYALEARHISRILRTAHLCRLPDDGGELVGLVVAGGAAVPVADLGSLLLLSGPDPTRPFVVLLGGTDLPLGLLVDEVESFGGIVEMALGVPTTGPEGTAPDQTDQTAPVEHGITADGVVMLDAEALLAHPSAVAVRTLRSRAQQDQAHPPAASPPPPPSSQENHAHTDHR